MLLELKEVQSLLIKSWGHTVFWHSNIVSAAK